MDVHNSISGHQQLYNDEEEELFDDRTGETTQTPPERTSS